MDVMEELKTLKSVGLGMKKRVFIVLILIAIFLVGLNNCYSAEQEVKEEALLKEAPAGKVIKLGNDLVDIKKADKNREVLISKTETISGNEPRSIYGYNVITTRKQAVLSPDMQYIAKVTNIYGHEDAGNGLLEYYNISGKKLFEKRYKDSGITCKVMKNGEYIVVSCGGGLFGDKEDTIEVFNKKGDLVLSEKGIDEYDFCVSPEGKVLFIEKKKNTNTILEMINLFNDLKWERTFFSDNISIVFSKKEDFIICEDITGTNLTNKTIYSFKYNGDLRWKKEYTYDVSPYIWFSENVHLVKIKSGFFGGFELYNNLNGELILKKEDSITIGSFTFTDYASTIISGKYILLTDYTFKLDTKSWEILIGLLDLKGNPLWSDKVLLINEEIKHYYQIEIDFNEKEKEITIWKKINEEFSAKEDRVKKLKTIKVNFEHDKQ